MLLRSQSGPNSGNGPALPELHRRLKWVALVGAAALFALVGRLWQLQVMRGEGYYERTVSNVVKERYLPSVRGKILDRKGVPLADNRPAFNLYVTPRQWKPETRTELVRLLGLSDDEIAKIDERLELGRKRDPKQPIVVLEDQGRDRASLVEQALARLPGVEVHHEPYRYYPQGDLAAHLVGYMTQMTAEEAEKLTNKGYDTSELVGRYGLEAAWENYLRGKKGIERFAVDARGQRLDDKTAATLIQGERVSRRGPGREPRAHDRRRAAAARRARGRDVAAAAVVVVEPKTGKLRAMVSKPSFDPNIMTGHLTRQEETLLKSDPRKPFVDKALRMTYPPGSVFKFVTALAALEDGQAAEDESVTCHGRVRAVGHDVPVQRRARQARPARRDPAVVQHLLLEARRAHRPRSDRGRRADVRLRHADQSRPQRRRRRPHPDEGLVRAARALQGRLRDQRGDRAGRRRGHACCRWRWRTRRSRTAARCTSRRSSSGSRPRRPADRRRTSRRSRARSRCRRTRSTSGAAACGRSPTSRAARRSTTATISIVPVMGKTGTAEIRTKRRKKEEDERDDRGLAPDALARVVRRLGAGRGSRDRDRRVRRARRLRRPRRVADREADPRGLLRRSSTPRTRRAPREGDRAGAAPLADRRHPLAPVPRRGRLAADPHDRRALPRSACSTCTRRRAARATTRSSTPRSSG